MPRQLGKLFEVRGDKEVSAALLAIPVEMRLRAVPAALRFAGKVIVEKASRMAPVATGLLRDSIGLLIRGKGTRPRYAAIGPRTGFGKNVVREGSPTVVYSDPSKYGHLVEFGTAQNVPAQPFLRPALQGAQGEVRQRLITSLERAQARAAKAAAKRG